MKSIAKSSSDLDAIESLLSSQSSEFRKLWNDYIKGIKSDETLEAVATFLASGQVNLAIEYIQDQSEKFNSAFVLMFIAAANFEIQSLAKEIKRELGLNYVKTYDSLNYFSNQQIITLQNNFKNAMKDGQQKLITSIIVDARSKSLDADATAKTIIDNLGLTEKQYRAVERYRELLKKNSRDSLKRHLRNKSMDGLVDEAIKNGSPLSESQIERLVRAYKRNYEKSRARMILNTQTKEITEAARQAGAEQVADELGIPVSEIVKEWRSMRDEQVRPTHQHGSLDGQIVPLDGVFVSSSGARLRYPGDASAPLSEIANCRCRVIRRLRYNRT